jgi:hypothetical protein
MKMMLVLAIAAAATIALPPPASAAQLDGHLLMYPGAKLADGMPDMPASAIAMGVPLVLATADSVATVDRWYGANAPKSCKRLAEGGRVQYKCVDGSIVIYTKGMTNIALVPNPGAMHM